MVDDIKPDIVAYSTNFLGFRDLVRANRRVQGIYKCLSIMGGSQVTFSPETFEESGMDIYCVGEGEYPFRDLLERLEQDKPYTNIDNFITKGRINPVRCLINNLDELPLADRDLVLSNSYLKSIPKRRFILLVGVCITVLIVVTTTTRSYTETREKYSEGSLLKG